MAVVAAGAIALRPRPDGALGAAKGLGDLFGREPLVVAQLGRRTLRPRFDPVVAEPSLPVGLDALVAQPHDLAGVKA